MRFNVKVGKCCITEAYSGYKSIDMAQESQSGYFPRSDDYCLEAFSILKQNRTLLLRFLSNFKHERNILQCKTQLSTFFPFPLWFVRPDTSYIFNSSPSFLSR